MDYAFVGTSMQVKSISIHGVKISGKDGSRQDLGILSYWHANPLKRFEHWMKKKGGFVALPAAAIIASELIHPSGLSGVILASVFTNAGKAIVTNRMIGSGTEPKFIGWGTGVGTSAPADTTLFTEADSRVSGTSSRVTVSVANDTYQVVGTMTAGTGETITNVGLFDAASSGNMLVKGDFAGVPLLTGDGINFTLQLQFQ